MEFNENNSIWLIEEGKENELIRGRIVVTNHQLWEKTMLKLQDIKTYIEGRCEICSSINAPSITPVLDGVIITSELRYGGFSKCYCFNPRYVAYSILQGNSSYLEKLFSTLETGETTIQPEIERARTLLCVLEKSSLDGKEIKTIVQKMWPNFGLYATDGLDCTEIEEVQHINLYELERCSNFCKRSGIAIPEELMIATNQLDVGKTNGKVLSLARKANALSKR